jgi:YD repeat-containing protein
MDGIGREPEAGGHVREMAIRERRGAPRTECWPGGDNENVICGELDVLHVRRRGEPDGVDDHGEGRGLEHRPRLRGDLRCAQPPAHLRRDRPDELLEPADDPVLPRLAVKPRLRGQRDGEPDALDVRRARPHDEGRAGAHARRDDQRLHGGAGHAVGLRQERPARLPQGRRPEREHVGLRRARPPHHYEYDLNGNVVETTDPSGTEVDDTFDAANRNTSRSVTLATGFLGTTSETRTFDGAGRMLTNEDNDYKLEFAYAVIGLRSYPYTETQSYVGMTAYAKTVTKTYDAAGNRATEAYPSGSGLSLAYTWNDIDNLSSISDGTNTIASDAWIGVRRKTETFQSGAKRTNLYTGFRRRSSGSTTATTRCTTGRTRGSGPPGPPETPSSTTS